MLRWFVLPCVAVLSVGIVAASQAGLDPYAWVEEACFPYFLNQLDTAPSAQARSKDAFLQSLNATRADLANGKRGLRDSARQVEQAAEQYFPTYLTMVDMTSEGGDREEKIARQLVEYLREEAPTASLSRIERELNQITTH